MCVDNTAAHLIAVNGRHIIGRPNVCGAYRRD